LIIGIINDEKIGDILANLGKLKDI
jgi:hypothetical protein